MYVIDSRFNTARMTFVDVQMEKENSTSHISLFSKTYFVLKNENIFKFMTVFEIDETLIIANFRNKFNDGKGRQLWCKLGEV